MSLTTLVFLFSGSDSHSVDLGTFLLYAFMRPDNKTPQVYDVNFFFVLSLDSWRSHSVTDSLKNGDASSSSLAAKGFRSVRPNLQDKKSPKQVRNPILWFLLKRSQEEQLVFTLMILFIFLLELNLTHLHFNWPIRISIMCPCPHPEEKVSTSHPLALIHQITAPLLPWLTTSAPER